jgi:hypothetical protein
MRIANAVPATLCVVKCSLASNATTRRRTRDNAPREAEEFNAPKPVNAMSHPSQDATF